MGRNRKNSARFSRMSHMLDRVRSWRDAEDGLSEITGAIFVLPILGFTIFALVETGVYMRYRIQVESILQDTAMSIAQDGGVFWSRTSPAGMGENKTWVTIGTQKLQALCDANSSSGNAGNRCKTDERAPVMQCWVGDVPGTRGGAGAGGGLTTPAALASAKRDGITVTNAPPTMVQVAAGRGAPVYCTTSFPYEPVSPLSKNYATSLGLSSLFNNNITLGASAQTVVGYENN